jgi:hypothetical protein
MALQSSRGDLVAQNDESGMGQESKPAGEDEIWNIHG